MCRGALRVSGTVAGICMPASFAVTVAVPGASAETVLNPTAVVVTGGVDHIAIRLWSRGRDPCP